MNNEETIIMQPQNENKANETSTVETPQTAKKPSNGKTVAAATAAAVGAGIIGGAGTAAAMGTDTEEQEVEATVDNAAPATAATTHAKPTTELEAKPEAVPVQDTPEEVVPEEVVPEDGTAHETTVNNGANNIAQNTTSQPQPQQTTNDGEDNSEVQVLGVYEHTTEEGVHQEAAILTNGQEVAVVIDENGNGEVDQLWVDENHDYAVQEGEIYDVSSEHVQMAQYENAYIAQQQQEQQIQQEQEMYASDNADSQEFNSDSSDMALV